MAAPFPGLQRPPSPVGTTYMCALDVKPAIPINAETADGFVQNEVQNIGPHDPFNTTKRVWQVSYAIAGATFGKSEDVRVAWVGP